MHLLVAEGDGGVHVFRAKEGGKLHGALSRGLSLIERVEAPLQVPADESQVEQISHGRLSSFPAP